MYSIKMSIVLNLKTYKQLVNIKMKLKQYLLAHKKYKYINTEQINMYNIK